MVCRKAAVHPGNTDRKSLWDADEQVRIIPFPTHGNQLKCEKRNTIECKLKGKLFEVCLTDRLVEEETRDKQYSNRNARKWSQEKGKLGQLPVAMWKISVNDPEDWKGSCSQLLGICTCLSLLLSSVTMTYTSFKWHFCVLFPHLHSCYYLSLSSLQQ